MTGHALEYREYGVFRVRQHARRHAADEDPPRQPRPVRPHDYEFGSKLSDRLDDPFNIVACPNVSLDRDAIGALTRRLAATTLVQ